ncbi:hypothetical protein AQUSIP_17190 [Aquicella siphonis]|uniref:Uncharacterized protein n=1 Tax=Aquicella siphonis TaxID=254247 RepID=A0A5E4PIZ3_9COXI|nr:hypothetical protein [Aquicella siphonis]VVC76407.1 hypothetical protein AQUSIP_17190 [Aquicella siphonis]
MPRFKRKSDSIDAPPAKKQKLTTGNQSEISAISTSMTTDATTPIPAMATAPANPAETIISTQQNTIPERAGYYGRRLVNLRGEFVDAPGADIITYDYWRDSRLVNGDADQLEFLLLNTKSNELIKFRPQSKEMSDLREFLKNKPDIRPLMKSDLNMLKESLLKDVQAIAFHTFRYRLTKSSKKSDAIPASTNNEPAGSIYNPKPVLPSISTLFGFNMFSPGHSTTQSANPVILNQVNANTLPPITQNANALFPLIRKQVTQVPQGNPSQQPKLLQLQPQPPNGPKI